MREEDLAKQIEELVRRARSDLTLVDELATLIAGPMGDVAAEFAANAASKERLELRWAIERVIEASGRTESSDEAPGVVLFGEAPALAEPTAVELAFDSEPEPAPETAPRDPSPESPRRLRPSDFLNAEDLRPLMENAEWVPAFRGAMETLLEGARNAQWRGDADAAGACFASARRMLAALPETEVLRESTALLLADAELSAGRAAEAVETLSYVAPAERATTLLRELQTRLRPFQRWDLVRVEDPLPMIEAAVAVLAAALGEVTNRNTALFAIGAGGVADPELVETASDAYFLAKGLSAGAPDRLAELAEGLPADAKRECLHHLVLHHLRAGDVGRARKLLPDAAKPAVLQVALARFFATRGDAKNARAAAGAIDVAHERVAAELAIAEVFADASHLLRAKEIAAGDPFVQRHYADDFARLGRLLGTSARSEPERKARALVVYREEGLNAALRDLRRGAFSATLFFDVLREVVDAEGVSVARTSSHDAVIRTLLCCAAADAEDEVRDWEAAGAWMKRARKLAAEAPARQRAKIVAFVEGLAKRLSR
ncbi:MAG: hypothetical protein AAGE52_40850 [Myxococcota bacterium]